MFSRFSCWCSVCRHLCSVSSVVSYLVSGLQCCAQCLVFVFTVLTAQAHCLASTFQREMASLSPLVLNVLFLCVRFDLSVGKYLVRFPNSQGSGNLTRQYWTEQSTPLYIKEKHHHHNHRQSSISLCLAFPSCGEKRPWVVCCSTDGRNQHFEEKARPKIHCLHIYKIF